MPAPYTPKPPSEQLEDMVLSGYAAQFLKAYCTFQHGTLIELFTSCSDKYIKGDESEKHLSIIMISVLMHEIIARDNLMEIINVLVTSSIQEYTKE